MSKFSKKNIRHGTLSITTQQGESIYPVKRSEFGVERYKGAAEIWFEIGTGKALDGKAGKYTRSWTPRLNASVLLEQLNPVFSEKTDFEIPCITEPFHSRGIERYSNANFSLYSHYGDWAPLGRSTIQLTPVTNGENEVDIFWESSLPGLSDDQDSTRVQLQARCQWTGESNVPYSFAYTRNMPWYCSYLIWIPLFMTLGWMAARFLETNAWIGGVAGFLAGNFIGHNLELNWQRRVNRFRAIRDGKDEKADPSTSR